MANARSSKRQLEKARQERAALKRDRRQGRGVDDATPGSEVEPGGDGPPERPAATQEQVLARLAALHQRFDDEQISFDDFEAEKAELTQLLRID